MKISFWFLLVFNVALLMPARAAGHPKQWTRMIELETGGRCEKPARIVDAQGASGGKAVKISAENAPDYVPGPPTGDPGVIIGQLDVPFALSEAASVFVWVRLKWHCVCSREIAYTTSATTFTSGENCTPTCISMGTAPGVWQWVFLGQGRFKPGDHHVTFFQRGHLTLVDAIALSTDPAYTPPGYTNNRKRALITVRDDAWRQDARGCFYVLDEQEWADWHLTVPILVPVQTKASPEARVGVRFRLASENRASRLMLQRISQNRIRAVWEDSEMSGESSCAAEVEGDGLWHALEVVKVGSQISACLNSQPLFETKIRLAGTATVELAVEGLTHATVEDVEIEELRSYTENFGQTTNRWVPQAGKWSILPEDTAAAMPAGYFGHGQTTCAATAPPQVFDFPITFNATLRPLSGFAGIACATGDADTFIAAGVSDSGGQPLFQIARMDQRNLIPLKSRPLDAQPGDWHHLKIEKTAACVRFSCDASQPWEFAAPSAKISVKTAFCVGPQSSALFTNMSAATYAPSPSLVFSFGADKDCWSLCHWRQRKGLFLPRQHPDLLVIRCEEGQALLEYRNPLPASFTAAMMIFSKEQRGGQHLQRPPSSDMPEIPLPVLPQDARIGFRYTVGAKCFEVSVDVAQTRSLQLTDDGECIGWVVLPPQTAFERELYMKLHAGTIEAGIAGQAPICAKTKDISADALGQLALFANGGPPDVEADLSQIRIEKLYPRLEE